MLKRIIQACFIIVGGTLGIFLIPELLVVIHASDVLILNNPYVSVLLGAIIFYFITFWLVDYVVNFMKWLEEQLVKLPITDIISGSLGLLVGLIVAFFIGTAFNSITVVPIILTLLFGYLGFQVGFKKRDELLNLLLKTSKKKSTNSDDSEEDDRGHRIKNFGYECHY